MGREFSSWNYINFLNKTRWRCSLSCTGSCHLSWICSFHGRLRGSSGILYIQISKTLIHNVRSIFRNSGTDVLPQPCCDIDNETIFAKELNDFAYTHTIQSVYADCNDLWDLYPFDHSWQLDCNSSSTRRSTSSSILVEHYTPSGCVPWTLFLGDRSGV